MGFSHLSFQTILKSEMEKSFFRPWMSIAFILLRSFRQAWTGTGSMTASLAAGAFTFPVSISHWISSCMVSR